MTFVDFTDGDGERADLETEVADRRRRHEAHDAVRAGLDLDLDITRSLSMFVTKPTKRLRAELRLSIGSGTSGARSFASAASAVPGSPRARLGDGQRAALDPAPDGVIADTEQASGL